MPTEFPPFRGPSIHYKSLLRFVNETEILVPKDYSISLSSLPSGHSVSERPRHEIPRKSSAIDIRKGFAMASNVASVALASPRSIFPR